MENNEELEFIMVSAPDGSKIKCEVVSTFEADETGKTYVIYTPEVKEGQEEVTLYGVELKVNENGPSFLNLTDEKDVKIVEEFIEKMSEEEID